MINEDDEIRSDNNEKDKENTNNSQPSYSYSWSQSDPYYTREQLKSKRGKHPKMRVLAIVVGIVFIVSATVLAGYGVYSLHNDIAGNNSQTQNGNSQNNTSSPQVVITDVKDYQKANEKTVVEGEPLTSVQIVNKVKPAVVGVVSEVSHNGFVGQESGSGIIMTGDGYIITNQHVIADASSVSVVFENGDDYKATIVGQDQKSDLAVLKIDAKNLTYAEFGNSDELKVGEPVIAIGNPLGLELFGTATSGIVSAINRDLTIEDRVMTVIQTDASINPGNSGGPLINQYGQVIGINSVKIATSEVDGLGFSIPINIAKPIVDELIQYGYVKDRPVIGITGVNVDELTSRYYGIPQGVLVRSISAGSGAEKAGVKEGDTIVKINGVAISNMSQLNSEKDKYKSGDTITLTIYRNGANVDLKVTLSEEKPVTGQ